MKTSNRFTFTRIILAPVLFFIYFIPEWLKVPDGTVFAILSVCIMIPLLGFAEFTDFLDGFFARKYKEVSDFGKMFDPFADVFLHLSMFTCFVFAGYMPPVLYILILYREFSQNFLRMVAANRGTAIAARKGGKLKTVMYVVACFVSLFQETLLRTGLAAVFGLNMNVLYVAGVTVYVVCVILSYVSFLDYLIHFGSVLKEAAE